MLIKHRKIFNKHIYNSTKSTALLNQIIYDIYYYVQAAHLTQFYLVITALAKEGCLQQLYTQNINGINTQLTSLKTLIPLPKKKPWLTTVQLHKDLKTV
jgi:NAD-dependent SIR2 family protein deacetylase